MTRNASLGTQPIHFRPVPLNAVTAPVLCKTAGKARAIASALGVAARQVSRPRAVGIVVGITVLVAMATLVPLPTAVQMRDWATAVGPWFPLAFLGAHIVATVVPVPRTAFTLAAGLLFGPALGVALAVGASTASALIAMLLVRSAGWRLDRLTRHQAVGALDRRLRERGWPAILSLRLIPAVPFSAINYAAGASAVRVTPYLLATLAGLVPGTAAVVILGDALTGTVNPLLLVVSVCTGGLGLAGLFYEFRRYPRQHSQPAS